MLIMKDNLVL